MYADSRSAFGAVDQACQAGQLNAFEFVPVNHEKLMKETLRLTGLKTKREAVELGLRTIVRLRKQQEIRRFRGKLPWQGERPRLQSSPETVIRTVRPILLRIKLK